MPISPPTSDLRETAVLDDEHLGDIHGAWGRLRVEEVGPRRSSRARLAALAAVSGPGLLALIADNDAGGIATYAQAGQDQGTRLLWVLLLLLPVLIVNQEMAARLGAVSGVGHARLILARFGRFWGSFAIGDLIILNGLTLVTEMIGVRLAAEVLGVPAVPAVAVCAIVLVIATSTGSFRFWERAMFALIAVNLAIVPLALLGGGGHATAGDALLPGLGTAGRGALVLVIALAGTTIAPWQLFFQQSSVVDKRITPRWLGYERLETVVGAVLMVGGAAAVMTTVAGAFSGTALAGHYSDAGAVAEGLGAHLGPAARILFAIVLLDGALLGAAAVGLATAYACSEVAGARHSLHRDPPNAPFFYGVIAVMIAVAAAVALAPGVPLGLLTVVVQVLAGVLLPSATVFLLLLSNDTQVLGPWVNPPWLNWLASCVIGALLMLSVLLVVSSLFPGLPFLLLGATLGALTVVGLLATGALTGWGRRPWARAELLELVEQEPPLRVVAPRHVMVLPRRTRPASPLAHRRRLWRMPPLEELKRPIWTRGRVIAMLALRGYLLGAVLVLMLRGVLATLGH